MRAVVFEGVGRVRVADVPDPVVEEPTDAVIRVTRTAICGSDLHFLRGKAPFDPGCPIGHEAVGVIERVGPGVGRFAVGDRVVAAFDIACGHCWFCRRGEYSLCESFRMLGGGAFGGALAGAQAEFVRVPSADVNLLGVPEAVEDERALFVGDVLTTGFHAASIAGVRSGDTLAVVGCGPLGYFCILSALALGAAQVFAIEREPERLSLAERAGATGVDPAKRHPQMALAEATEGRGADEAIEAVGSTEAFETAVDVARRGGTVVVVGTFAGETVQLQLGAYWARALTLRFTGLAPIHARWNAAMAQVEAGTIDPLPLVSHRLPLEEAPRGYELFERREATKVVLIP